MSNEGGLRFLISSVCSAKADTTSGMAIVQSPWPSTIAAPFANLPPLSDSASFQPAQPPQLRASVTTCTP